MINTGISFGRFTEYVDILDSERVPVNSRDRAKRKGDVPYYGATGQVDCIDDYLFDEELVLLGEDGAPFLDPYRNKAYLISGKSWVNNHAHVLRGKNGLSNRLLLHWLNAVNYRDYVGGTTRDKLSQAKMREIPVPVVTPKYQGKLIDVIETQFTRLDAAIKSLKAIKAKLELYRKSVLKASFDRDWQYDKLGKIFETTSGGTPSRSVKKYYTGDIPWLKSGELNDNMNIEDSEEHITSEAVDNSSAKRFPSNTALIALYGATTGKVGILRKESTTNQAVCGIFPQKGYMPEFVFYFLLSKRASLISQGKGGAQPNISQGIVRDIDFPEVDEKTQRGIIDSIESQLSVIDKLKIVVDASLAKAEKLRKSILKSAFEGKLVN